MISVYLKLIIVSQYFQELRHEEQACKSVRSCREHFHHTRKGYQRKCIEIFRNIEPYQISLDEVKMVEIVGLILGCDISRSF